MASPSLNKRGRPPEGLEAKMVSMPPETWKTIDSERGDLPRGRYIASLLFGPVISVCPDIHIGDIYDSLPEPEEEMP